VGYIVFLTMKTELPVVQDKSLPHAVDEAGERVPVAAHDPPVAQSSN